MVILFCLSDIMEIDWHRIFFSDQPYTFFLEILFRTTIMFIVVVVVLRLTGKRGVQQLSIFEIVMILTLGSAAGDPMFYQEVGLLHAIAVFAVVLGIYRLMIYVLAKNEKIEEFLEGKAIYIIRDGLLCLDEIAGDELGSDEFFATLRGQNVEHFGQIRCAIMENAGTISVFYFADEDVRPGLPILPDEYNKKSKKIDQHGLYACTYCGSTVQHRPSENVVCRRCGAEDWVLAIDRKRIT